MSFQFTGVNELLEWMSVRSARLKAVFAVDEVGRAFRALVSYTTDRNHQMTSTAAAEYNSIK